MKKLQKSAAALALACLMLLFAACSLVSVNEGRDNAQVVAKVNGVEITKGEFKSSYYYMVNMYAQLYSQMGMQPDYAGLKTDTMDALVRTEVLRQKAVELGFASLTAEEQAKADADFDTQWQSYISSYRVDAEAQAANAGGEPSAEELDKRAEELLLADMETEGMTKEDMKQSFADQIASTKLQESVNAEVVVTDADIQAGYDQKVADQTTKYAETPSAYGTDAESAIVAHIPAGYIRVKHILIKPDDTDEAYIEYEEKTTALQNEITDLGSQVGTLYSEGSAENQAQIAGLDAQISAKRAEEALMRENYLAGLKPKADEALAKAKAGEDFDALIETYGNDPGMTVSPTKEEGYLLYAAGPAEESGYDADFFTAAAALANVGDISELVPTTFGYHIIRLSEKVAPGNVPLDNIKEAIREEVKSTKETELWNTRQEEWIAAATVETFPDVVADVE